MTKSVRVLEIETTAGQLAAALYGARAYDLLPEQVEVSARGNVVYTGTTSVVRRVSEDAKVTLVAGTGNGWVEGAGWIVDRFGILGLREVERAIAGLGISVADYRKLRDSLKRKPNMKGGKAYGKTFDVDENELRAGIREEMEHTDDPGIALEIALDHLIENPRYYKQLKATGL